MFIKISKNSIMKNFSIFILLLLQIVNVYSQTDCVITHYSSEDGLSENTVMDILQDKKGNMWFSTWNGINKFDGYTFHPYKGFLDNEIALTNNRVDCMELDKYGYIWMLTYDERAFRFNPSSEIFESVPDYDNTEIHIPITRIKTLPNGNVWLLSENRGAIRIITDSISKKITTEYYSSGSEVFPVSSVFNVYQIGDDEWVLSDNGLACFNKSGNNPEVFFELNSSGKDGIVRKQKFFTLEENKDKLFFGANNGYVWILNKGNNIFTPLKLPIQSNITGIKYIEKNDKLIIASKKDGFFVYDVKNDTYEHFKPNMLPDASIDDIYKDTADEVWFEQNVTGEVAHYNPYTNKIKIEKVYAEPTNTDRSRPAFHIHEDIFGSLWVHPYGGGFSYFDREKNSLVPFYNSMNGGKWHFSNKIHSAFSDRQGNLWMCTHSKGLEKVTFRTEHFRIKRPVESHYETLSNEVRAYQEYNGNLWVGLKDGMLKVYDNKYSEIGYMTETGRISKSGAPLLGNVYYMMRDSKGIMWLATKGAGLIKAEPTADAMQFRLTRYQYNPDDIYSLSDNNVYCIYEDNSGRIWIATFSNGINYITKNEKDETVFINHRNILKGFPIKECNKVRYITADEKNRLWIATTGGLVMTELDFENPSEAVFHHYMRSPDDPTTLSNNDVHWITPTHNGELYIATFGGGLNRLNSISQDGKVSFKTYTVKDGLPSDILLSIQEDKNGLLWISTENGLTKFNPEDERFENFQDRHRNFKIRFSEASSEYLSNGDMVFGTNQGIFYFNPDSIKKSIYEPPVIFTQLLLANNTVVPGTAPLKECTIDDIERLTLSHKENIFTIQFAALDYTTPSDIQYAYILDGFEKNWNYVGKQRMATYTNLPKGDYVFKVRSTNSDGVWIDNTRNLNIRILPSFWETPLAYLIYVFVLLLIVFTAVYILSTIYRLKHKVVMEHQLTDLKLRFFTDISHELRTPLTLITAPLENILEEKDLPDGIREQLSVVERNANRMLRLVNQILDFRKIQNKKMKMQVQLLEVVSFTRKVMEYFEAVAKERNISYDIETNKSSIYLWVDADKYEKIIYNLLSNAFKYTPDGKSIKITIHENEDTVAISVIDKGVGITENKKKKLFVRFENHVETKGTSQLSTGIGLSLVKDFVDMHKAEITVTSKPNEGSCFKIDFKKGKEHYDNKVEFLQNDMDYSSGTEYTVAECNNEVTKEDEEINTNKDIMLIVEDNSELRQFLHNIFNADYHVIEAANGEEGKEKALKYVPDIIISDVMMPVKDGFQMMQELRGEITTSHIPLILLTAKTAIESKLEGLEYGADDYITKPFSATYLKARVKNILQRKLKIQQAYRERLLDQSLNTDNKTEDNESQVPDMSPSDRKFMDKLLELMESRIDNSELVVDDLVKEMAVSRSVFFKKLKTLTGLAPVEFIKEVRINKAIKLIESGEYSITQIAYMVGINDPRYFSKCFKQKMGMTPSEYRDQKAQNK
ncbi:two-component regulator propeller domain-containing protein [Bacteroides sp.]|uniref:hybrid sensor histidine kinase/response regulator transcription factor n=1 Tax=Bacteroides sp. TaxID=29523 RepID=UPI0025897747|nr:two-component regulator propeller domain-containing protein [Bacteroides sp.]